MSKITVEMFPSLEGDCILISLEGEQSTHILIDGGFKVTYENYLKPRLQEIAKKGEHLALVVVTHIDSDHIEGILEFFKENNSSDNPRIISIDEVWHNSYRHLQFGKETEADLNWKERAILSDIIAKCSINSKLDSNEDKGISAEQGSSLAALLNRGKYNWNQQFDGMAVSSDNKNLININSDISIRLLSPNREKLEKLREYWLLELRKEKYDFKLTNDKLFDDAYEFYLMKQKEIEKAFEDKEISHKEKSKKLEFYLDKRNNFDYSPANGSSISFILEYKGKKLLFLGDSHPQLIKLEIEKLLTKNEFTPFFDLIKVSHHGSQRNTSKDLLKIIDSKLYLLSSNGGRNNHPSAETIARIVCRPTQTKRMLIFNYPHADRAWNDINTKEKYNFDVCYPEGNKSTVIDV